LRKYAGWVRRIAKYHKVVRTNVELFEVRGETVLLTSSDGHDVVSPRSRGIFVFSESRNQHNDAPRPKRGHHQFDRFTSAVGDKHRLGYDTMMLRNRALERLGMRLGVASQMLGRKKQAKGIRRSQRIETHAEVEHASFGASTMRASHRPPVLSATPASAKVA